VETSRFALAAACAGREGGAPVVPRFVDFMWGVVAQIAWRQKAECQVRGMGARVRQRRPAVLDSHLMSTAYNRSAGQSVERRAARSDSGLAGLDINHSRHSRPQRLQQSLRRGAVPKW
jgi:hypothetical protein